MVGAVKDDVAVCHDTVHVAVGAGLTGNHIPLVVAAHRTGREPVLLRMDQNGVVLGGVKVQNGFQNLVADLDKLHGFPGGLFRLRRNDGHHIPHEPHMPVNNQPVVGGGLGIGLARDGKAGLGHILPGVDVHNAGNLFGYIGPDFLHNGIGVGTAENLHYQGILRGNIVHINGLAREQLHGILLPEGLAHGFVGFLFHGILLTPCGCPKRRGCPGAGRHSRSSGTGSRPRTSGFHRR